MAPEKRERAPERLSHCDEVLEEILRDMLKVEQADIDTLSFSRNLTRSRKPLDQLALAAGLITGDEHDALLKTYLRRRIETMRKELSGSRVGSYDILEEIASGGMGIVFKARQESPMFTRDVAIKFMLAGPEADEDDRERFVSEGKGLANLNHPFLVSILDSGIEEDLYYFSMELVDGWSLEDWPENRPLSVERKVEIVRDIARALDYLHRNEVIHRDVKPANIMVDRSGTPKLLDFGIAQFSADPRTRVLQAGSPHYMAPEVIDPTGPFGSIGPGTDIYALGAVLYRLLVGKEVFQREKDISEIFHLTLHAPPAFPRTPRSRLPHELERIITRCLQKKVSDRYASAFDLVADLDAHLRRRGVLRKAFAAAALASALLVWLFAADDHGPAESETAPFQPSGLEVWDARIDEAAGADFEAIGLSPESLGEDIAALERLLEGARKGDELALLNLGNRWRKFWDDKIARATNRVWAASDKAGEALLAADAAEARDHWSDARERLKNAESTNKKKTYENLLEVEALFRKAQSRAAREYRWRKQQEHLRREKEAASEAKERALTSRSNLLSNEEVIFAPEVKKSQQRAEELLAAADRSFQRSEFAEAAKLYEQAGKEFRSTLAAGEDAFLDERGKLQAQVIEKRERFDSRGDMLARTVLEEMESALEAWKKGAEESLTEEPLRRAQVEACGRNLEEFDKLFDSALASTYRLKHEAQRWKVKVGPLEASERERTPERLESALRAADDLLTRGEKDLEKNEYRAAAALFQEAKDAFDGLRAQSAALTRDMAWVEGGAISYSAAENVQREEVAAFWMDRFEVSVADFAEFLHERAESSRELEPYGWEAQLQGDRNLPVTGVTLGAAMAYAAFRKKELPTRGMWELAARRRVGELHRYPYGARFDPRRSNGRGDEDGFPHLAPVRSLPEGASDAGCLHMSGNASEWAVAAAGSVEAAWVMGGSCETGEPRFLAGDYGYLPRSLSGAPIRLVGFRCALRASKTVERREP